jgi:hypothetical protein
VKAIWEMSDKTVAVRFAAKTRTSEFGFKAALPGEEPGEGSLV